MARKLKTTAKPIDTLTKKDCADNGAIWAKDYPLNLFSGDAKECQFTREDLRSSFVAGISYFFKCVWHDPIKELPNDGEWCLLHTTSGFRLAVRRETQSGVHKWWLMDYSLYDGKGINRWAYVSDLVLYK